MGNHDVHFNVLWRAKSQDGVHKPQLLKGKESQSRDNPSHAYKPNALFLDQSRQRWECLHLLCPPHPSFLTVQHRWGPVPFLASQDVYLDYLPMLLIVLARPSSKRFRPSKALLHTMKRDWWEFDHLSQLNSIPCSDSALVWAAPHLMFCYNE